MSMPPGVSPVSSVGASQPAAERFPPTPAGAKAPQRVPMVSLATVKRACWNFAPCLKFCTVCFWLRKKPPLNVRGGNVRIAVKLKTAGSSGCKSAAKLFWRALSANHLIFAPGAMPSRNMTFAPSSVSAASIIPLLSTPQRTAGLRFDTSTTVLSTSWSGV